MKFIIVTIFAAISGVIADFLQLPPNTTYDLPSIKLKMQSQNLEIIRLRANAFFATLPSGLKEDAKLTVPEIIKKYGYSIENHVITTLDGYIITLHRIPHGRRQRLSHRPAILLQHGLMSSSADWIISGPEKALDRITIKTLNNKQTLTYGNVTITSLQEKINTAIDNWALQLRYILADEGFDVWMGNVRGTRYSRNHTRLDTSFSEYWQFSWHEIAVSDTAMMIDYILATTKQQKLKYIGHSQGTTVFYVLCSEKPEYNNKIQMHISLSPVVYMKNAHSPIFHYGSTYNSQLEALADLFGVNEYIPDEGFLLALSGNMLCSDGAVTQILCMNGLFSLMGFNEKAMNKSLIPLILAHGPSGSSTKQFLHYAQEATSGKFRQYDYGLAGNLAHYNSANPPEYQLENIRTPIYMFWSKNDWMSHETDINHLCSRLKKTSVEKILIDDKEFNHLDYLYAINVRELVYNKLISILAKYN